MLVIIYYGSEGGKAGGTEDKQAGSEYLIGLHWLHIRPSTPKSNRNHVLDNPGVKDIQGELFVLVMNTGN